MPYGPPVHTPEQELLRASVRGGARRWPHIHRHLLDYIRGYTDHMTQAEAAAELGLPLRTLQRWLAKYPELRG